MLRLILFSVDSAGGSELRQFLIALGAVLLYLSLSASASASPVAADRDADKVFDDLERRLARAGASDEVGVIVALSAPGTAARVEALAEEVGGFATGRRFTLVDAFSARMTRAQVRALARSPEVEHVEENSRLRALNDSAQDSFGVTRARVDAGVDGDGDGAPAWYSPVDLVAAVLDTGIDASHRDLDGRKVLAFVDCLGRRCGSAWPSDGNGHGTHVAATLAGEGDGRVDRLYRGVAPGAGLVGVRVLNAEGAGTADDFLAGLQWVVANKAALGIEAVNVSVGASGCSDGSDVLSRAIDGATDAGLVVVVAAGNEGPGSCTIGTPAAARGALTVGAMSDLSTAGFGLAASSSRGPTADGRVKPDIGAPAVDIRSAAAGTGSGYAEASGTSMSAPFVAGVALLMLDVNPALQPGEVKARMMGAAVDWGSPGPDPEYGAGRLDAYAAVRAAGAGIASPPAVPTHASVAGALEGPNASVEYRLPVADTRFPLAATLTVPTPGAATSSDFDLELLDPRGVTVAAGRTALRQEQLSYPAPGPGSYTLRVSSAGAGGAFVVDLSAGLAAAPVVAARDVERPRARALRSRGRRGHLVRLGYRVSDNSGKTWERIRVQRGARLLRTITTRLAPRRADRTHYVTWRVPRTVVGRLRFCVQARDAARNASALACAPVRIR